MKLADALEDFTFQCECRRLSPQTIRNYQEPSFAFWIGLNHKSPFRKTRKGPCGLGVSERYSW